MRATPPTVSPNLAASEVPFVPEKIERFSGSSYVSVIDNPSELTTARKG